MISIYFLFYLAGIALLIVAARNYRGNYNLTGMIATIIAVLLISIASVGRFESSIQKKLSREVRLEEVSVKGWNKFRAAIEISYENGKIISIDLISNTTVAVTNTPASPAK